MSCTSLTDLIENNLSKSLSQNDGSEQVSIDEHHNLFRYVENRSSKESTEQNSSDENSSSTSSIKLKIWPITTTVKSDTGNEKSVPELEDFQTESKSFDSHIFSNYDENVDFDTNTGIKAEPNGDVSLPSAEEQGAPDVSGIENSSTTRGFTNSRDPIENLVSATLAFREVSYNQCDLLRAQTDAINRLAIAIEEQNAMMSRFHTIVRKSSTKNLGNDTDR